MKRFSIFIYIFLLVAEFAGALTPREIMEKALTSEKVRQFGLQSDADIAARSAENLLSGPEVEFEHLWARGGETKWTISATQNFDWPGVYGVRSKMLRQDKLTNKYLAEALLIETRFKVSEILVQLSFNQKRIEVLDALLKEMSEMMKSTDDALEHGLITILDAKKQGIESTMLAIEKDRLIQTKGRLLTELTEIVGEEMNYENTDWSEIPVMLTLSSHDFYISQAGNVPSVLASESMTKSAALGINEAKASTMPGLGIGYRHEKEENMHFNGFSVSINLPKWNMKRTASAAKQFLLATQHASDLEKATLITRINSEYKTATELSGRIKSLRTNGVDGDYPILLKEALDGGEITLFDYLREQSYYRSAILSLIDLEEQYTLLLASLNRYLPN